jgi:hypothetical protein
MEGLIVYLPSLAIAVLVGKVVLLSFKVTASAAMSTISLSGSSAGIGGHLLPGG